MKDKLKKKRYSLFRNRFFVLLFSLYLILLIITSYFTCYFSYQQKKEALLAQFDTTYVQLLQEYRNITDNFWQIYMPIFENNNSLYGTVQHYFSIQAKEDLSPVDKTEVTYMLKQMLLRDNEIQWIAVFNPHRNTNYILYNDGASIRTLPTDFPYMEELLSSSRKMEIYGAKVINRSESTPNSFAICSSVTPQIGEGKIMIGYSTSPFKNICGTFSTDIDSLNFVITNKEHIVFDSSGKYDTTQTYCPSTQGISLSVYNDQEFYTKTETCGLNTSLASYYVLWQEVFLHCHSLTPIFLIMVFVFALASIISYMTMLHMINKEVIVIQSGLDRIAENHLDYQLPTDLNQNGFPEIASSINHMTLRLKDNIQRAHDYELKQHEAELSELQSKFNPHFLYNSLEMLRSRCYQNGDEDTAELITQLSAIFRGFIGSRNFVPITEELTSSKRYLALFGARYEDNVKILYDFDTDILRYGIIRNLFQPLIENYFVHGFDTSNEENYILFRGKSLDDKTMVLTMEDNGNGMSEKDINRLNEQLHTPIKLDTESYGLKNLHQRLQLFYGENYGLTIYPNPNTKKGLCIQMTARKMTVQEYEEGKRD